MSHARAARMATLTAFMLFALAIAIAALMNANRVAVNAHRGVGASDQDTAVRLPRLRPTLFSSLQASWQYDTVRSPVGAGLRWQGSGCLSRVSGHIIEAILNQYRGDSPMLRR